VKENIQGKRTLENFVDKKPRTKLNRANCIFKQTDINEPIEKKIDLFKLKSYFHLEFVSDYEGFLWAKENNSVDRVYVRFVEKGLYIFDDKNKLLRFSYIAECYVENGLGKTISNKNLFSFSLIYPDEKIKVFYSDSEEERNKWFYKLRQKLNQKTITEFYKLDDKSVKDSRMLKSFNKFTNEYNILKIYKKANIQDYLVAKRQIEILNICNHPGLVKCIDYFEDRRNLYLVTEAFDYKTLKTYILEKPSLTEKEASLIISQLIDCIEYCHKKSIILRNLDYINVLIGHDGLVVKISDVENAVICFPGQKCYEKVVTMCSPPEFIYNETGYSAKCDIWNIGILIYFILTKNMPMCDSFNSEAQSDNNYENVNYEDLGERSDVVKELIKKCLEINPDERVDLKDLKKDKWFFLFWD
jgi:serine/threonine protein kinase